MGRNTSMALGDHFENFVDYKIAEGRFKNASEVIRAGLRLLEEEEHKISLLQRELKVGEESKLLSDFNPKDYLEKLHAKHLK